MRNKFKILLLLAAFSAGPGALASDFQSPRTAALGGAGHAAPLLNDGIYLNPSYSSFLPTYSFATPYSPFSGPAYGATTDFHGRMYNLSILDGRAELFQAGAGYTVRQDGAFLHFGASKSLLKTLGVGLGAKFFMSPDHSNTQDGTLSVSFVATPWFQTALIIDNLAQTQTGKNHGLYREIILGTKFNLQGKLMAYFDPHFIPDLPNAGVFGHELGLEVSVFQDLYARFGNFRNANVPAEALNGNGWTLGMGWVAPRISFDYGYQHVVDPHSAGVHTFGATLYL